MELKFKTYNNTEEYISAIDKVFRGSLRYFKDLPIGETMDSLIITQCVLQTSEEIMDLIKLLENSLPCFKN